MCLGSGADLILKNQRLGKAPMAMYTVAPRRLNRRPLLNGWNWKKTTMTIASCSPRLTSFKVNMQKAAEVASAVQG